MKNIRASLLLHIGQLAPYTDRVARYSFMSFSLSRYQNSKAISNGSMLTLEILIVDIVFQCTFHIE
jgi:hypothetical protein